MQPSTPSIRRFACCSTLQVRAKDEGSHDQTVSAACRAQLDVMRLDTPTMHRFACCVASYGYMGDLMAQSETLRWMGPTRYNIAGAFVLFRGRAYHASVSYLPAPALARSGALSEAVICFGWYPAAQLFLAGGVLVVASCVNIVRCHVPTA